MKKGQFINLEGIDGVGKTSCVKALCEKLEKTQKVIYINRKTVPTEDEYVRQHMQNLYDIMWGKGKIFSKSPDIPYNGFTREHWLHLMIAWYSAFEKHVIKPVLGDNYTIITDGYIYKEIVKAVYSSGTFKTASEFDFLIKPDVVLYLTAAPKECVRIDSMQNRIENGMFVGTEDGFVEHQSRMKTIYDKLAMDNNWLIIERNVDVNVTCRRILKALNESGNLK